MTRYIYIYGHSIRYTVHLRKQSFLLAVKRVIGFLVENFVDFLVIRWQQARVSIATIKAS